jgi:hypothetical protein
MGGVRTGNALPPTHPPHTHKHTDQKGHAALLRQVDRTALGDTLASMTMRAKGMEVVAADRGL